MKYETGGRNDWEWEKIREIVNMKFRPSNVYHIFAFKQFFPRISFSPPPLFNSMWMDFCILGRNVWVMPLYATYHNQTRIKTVIPCILLDFEVNHQKKLIFPFSFFQIKPVERRTNQRNTMPNMIQIYLWCV